MSTVLLAVIVALLLCTLFMGVLLYKRSKSLVDQKLSGIEQENMKVLSRVTALAESSQKFDSPISRLTFPQSFNSDLFSQASKGAADAELVRLSKALSDSVADGLQITLQGVRMTQQGAEMIVSASASGKELIKEGVVKFQIHKATGVRLPKLVNAKTGRVFEELKEMPVSKITSKLATVSGAVISAAHLIAGADLAKSMARIDSKLDRLLALHRVDQLAKLERIYMSARELAFRPMDKDSKLEMWRLRGELRELRSAWRQECSQKLSQIEDPDEATWYKRWFSRQRSIDQRTVDNISQGESEVFLIHYAMRLEHVLSIGSDTIDEFIYSQASELEQLDELNHILKEKSEYISKKYPELSAEPMMDALSMLITTCHQYIPEGNIIQIDSQPN